MEIGFGFMSLFIYITLVCLSETDSGGGCAVPFTRDGGNWFWIVNRADETCFLCWSVKELSPWSAYLHLITARIEISSPFIQ